MDPVTPTTPITPVTGKLSDLFANPALRHAAQTVFSVAVMFASIWMSARLGIPLPVLPAPAPAAAAAPVVQHFYGVNAAIPAGATAGK